MGRLFCGDVGVEILFDDMEVGVGGAAEVFELVAGEFEVGTGADFLVDTGGADFVADGELAGVVGFVVPAFEPDPDIFLVMEEFAAVAGGDGAENSATEAGLGVNEVAAGHEGGAAERFRGVGGGGWVGDGAGWDMFVGGDIAVGLGAGVGDFEGVLDAGAGDFGSAGGFGWGLRGLSFCFCASFCSGLGTSLSAGLSTGLSAGGLLGFTRVAAGFMVGFGGLERRFEGFGRLLDGSFEFRGRVFELFSGVIERLGTGRALRNFLGGFGLGFGGLSGGFRGKLSRFGGELCGFSAGGLNLGAVSLVLFRHALLERLADLLGFSGGRLLFFREAGVLTIVFTLNIGGFDTCLASVIISYRDARHAAISCAIFMISWYSSTDSGVSKSSASIGR